MRLQRSWVPGLVVGVLSLASGGWLLQQGTAATGGGVYGSARLFEEVHRLVAERYVEEVDPAELYEMAIDGMLNELGDPYTTFLDRSEFQELQLSTTGNYGGLGIRIASQDGWITVMGVISGTPAERAGMQTGDRIIEVEGESAEGWNEDRAVRVLRGPKGSDVTLTVARVGVDRPLRFTIRRDDIHVVAVKSFMLDDRVGFVRLEGFSRESTTELQDAIEGLREQGATSLVLDLRFNSGGLLEEGIAIADLFLPRGAQVVETRSRLADQNQRFAAPGDERYTDLPLVVLVGPYSASASEIVAGALQDHDRALILGTPSFGKGSVQTLYGLTGGNYLKVTTAHWYTPSGRSINKPHGRDARLGELISESITMEGQPVPATVDTAARETFRTAAGRTVYGGGGITPDLIVSPDTLTSREQVFRSAVVKGGMDTGNAAFHFGVRWTSDHPGMSPDFQVTSAMREAFFRYLADEVGADVDRALFEDVREYVDYLLSVGLANVAFGETEQLARRAWKDSQIGEAVALLRQARTPAELFTLAEAHSRRRGAEDPDAGG